MKHQRTADIIGFYDLPDEWREEAVKNLGDKAKEALYLEPTPGDKPKNFVLRDLTKLVRTHSEYEGIKYNGRIALPHNSIMLLSIGEHFESATYIYV